MRKLVREQENPYIITPQEAKPNLKKSLNKILQENSSTFSLLDELDICLECLSKMETDPSMKTTQANYIVRLGNLFNKIKVFHATAKLQSPTEYNQKVVDNYLLRTENIKPLLTEILGFIDDRSVEQIRESIQKGSKAHS